MKGIRPRGGLVFRFVISAVVSILVISVMSMAMAFASGGVAASGGFLDAGQSFLVIEAMVGLLTFLGSFYVLSKK